MLKREYDGQNCSIARALELVGERWTLLIVRDAFFGLRRFDEFQDSLGIASNVLASRLDRLVEAGIFERVRYQQRPDRFEYRLTERGRALRTPLLALMQWGDGIGGKPPRVARRKRDGSPVVAALVGADGKRVEPGEIEVVSGPGATKRKSQRTSPAR
jgi:DNA-binding HxlR family transcriptional regulator